MRGVLKTLAVVLAVVAATDMWAGARRWMAADLESFARGELDQMEVDAEGRLRLAAEFRTLWGPQGGSVWALAASGDGGVFVAVSGPARVLKVSEGGEEEVWYQPEGDRLVTALARDGGGGLVVGLTGPGELVHLTGPGEVAAALPTNTDHVWALYSPGDGMVRVGTGGPGRILSWRPGAGLKVLLETGEDPVRCLAPSPDGKLLAGTGKEGRVLEVDRDGSARALADLDEPEVVAVAPARDGTLFLLAAGPSRSPARKPSAPSPSQQQGQGMVMEVRVTAPANGGPAEGNGRKTERAPSTAKPRRTGGSLYRLDRGAALWRLWASGEDVPYDLALDPEGNPVVATGGRGRVFRMDRDGRAVRLIRFPSDTVSVLEPDDGVLFLGGAEDARIAKLGPGRAREGTYRSEPIDAGSMAQWGSAVWEGEVPKGSKVRLRARSGNASRPDETWSGWVTLAEAPSRGRTPLTVPAARYLQLEIRLTRSGRGGEPSVRSVETYFQLANRPPRILSIELEPPGIAWARIRTQTSAGRGPVVADDPVSRAAADALRSNRTGGVVRRSYETGARTVHWNAEDPDGDALRYRLDVRREGEETWFELARDLEDTFFSWDSRSLPDGRYRIRLTAADRAGNWVDTGYEDSKVSEPFDVDHTPPHIESVRVDARRDGSRALEWEAVDPGGRVVACEVAAEGDGWVEVAPVDGVADGERERYRLLLPQDGPARIRIRVTDQGGNQSGRLQRLDGP